MMLEHNRRSTPGERLERTFNLTHLVRTIAIDFLRQQYPAATEAEWRRAMARRFLARDVADAVILDLDRRGL